MQHSDGGWGLSGRDDSRIPTTSLAVTLLPSLANQAAMRWLIQEWERDLRSKVKLTYKGGFLLMALAAHRDLLPAPQLVEQTIEYLAAEQNLDGGFGPWRGHPIGSDPWSTGITLVGLTSWPEAVDARLIQRAVSWLCDTQLESGLWAYHFIDEGSAYAYWGLSRAVEYLEGLAR
ncbi:MAG TPA: terpene cyclase/mutase family protein [Firmicutes bacterium]|nr:terpene cyclase/mutase family protein [Bacillota bacterium]